MKERYFHYTTRAEAKAFVEGVTYFAPLLTRLDNRVVIAEIRYERQSEPPWIVTLRCYENKKEAE